MSTRVEKALKYAGLKSIPDDEEKYYNANGCDKYYAFLAAYKISQIDFMKRAEDFFNNHLGISSEDATTLIEAFKDFIENE